MSSMTLTSSTFNRVNNCGDFMSIILNSSSVRVNLTQSVDCSGMSTNFFPLGNSTNPFRGTFEGNGFTISNVTINTNGQCAGIFCCGVGATVMNVVFQDVNITSSNYTAANAGALFGVCQNGCNITNVNMTTSNPSKTNTIQCNGDYCGGLVGQFGNKSMAFDTSNMINCIVQNTFVVNFACKTGGVVGENNAHMKGCHNLGINGDPSRVVVQGNKYIGGHTHFLTKKKPNIFISHSHLFLLCVKELWARTMMERACQRVVLLQEL